MDATRTRRVPQCSVDTLDCNLIRGFPVFLLTRGVDQSETPHLLLVSNYISLINLQVLSVFQEKRIISDETARFEELLVRQRDIFVEEELKEKYRRLISFVQLTEVAMSSGNAGESR